MPPHVRLSITSLAQAPKAIHSLLGLVLWSRVSTITLDQAPEVFHSLLGLLPSVLWADMRPVYCQGTGRKHSGRKHCKIPHAIQASCWQPRVRAFGLPLAPISLHVT